MLQREVQRSLQHQSKLVFAFKLVLFLLITHISLVGDLVQQAFLDPQQVGGWCHHYIDQDLRNNGDKGVLPSKGVKEGCYCMNDLG